MHLGKMSWVPEPSAAYIENVVNRYSDLSTDHLNREIERLVGENRQIHDQHCINLNPATNTMNPRAEAMLSSGLGSRPSLGYPGDKYEMGLEAIEKIEILAAGLACEIFNANYAEIRVGSGSLANLYAFMATCRPGDRIIVPPAAIGGHVTHHMAGAAGLYGVDIHEAPINASQYTVDVDALRTMAHELRPKLITIGGSLNLGAHPVEAIRGIADEVEAIVLFDAAHLSGLIAGNAWPNPLAQGAHLMTMSTYKSLGGPPSGLIVTNEADLARTLDPIAFPGLTANFDVGNSAALAITLLDWRTHGDAYARSMVRTAAALAEALASEGVPVFKTDEGFTFSHQIAIEAARFKGGQSAAKRLRRANLLTSGIGLPLDPVENDLNGLRLGTPEIVRWGIEAGQMPQLARFIADALLERQPLEKIAASVSAFRSAYKTLHYID